jgi:threonine dehydratase
VTLRQPTFDDIINAARALSGHTVVTPLLRSDLLDLALGCRLFIKAENLQHTGSFKFRGAFTAINRLDEAKRKRGVVAYSSGNHGQAVAAAARLFGVAAKILMPSDAPEIKKAQTLAQGAEIQFYDRQTENRETLAEQLAAEAGRALVKPYDSFDTICGQGTVGSELASQCRQLQIMPDVVLVPCGGGGLTAGIAIALETALPTIPIYAVEPEGFDDTKRSLVAGKPVSNQPGMQSLCDALMTATPGELTFAINQKRLAGVYTVSDDEVLLAIRLAAQHLKITLEPGGAAALAAVTGEQLGAQDKTVMVVASGGNVDTTVFSRALSTGRGTG